MKLRQKSLDLKVTVAGENPDAVLAKTDKLNFRLTLSPYNLKVTSVERADGQPFGMEGAFEEYWRETHCEDDSGDSPEKAWAREAFLYGVKFGKGQA